MSDSNDEELVNEALLAFGTRRNGCPLYSLTKAAADFGVSKKKLTNRYNAAIAPLSHALLRHAAGHIARRIAELKTRNRQFGFADMLRRLKDALEGANGEALRARIVRSPVMMIASGCSAWTQASNQAIAARSSAPK